MWYALSALLIVGFFVVTYPNGFIVLGWTLFYSFWWLGLALVAFPFIVLFLPYVGRASEWEAERIKVRWLSRLFGVVARYAENRAKRIALPLTRFVIAFEYHVVNQCAKIHHKQPGVREQLFLEHITKVISRVLRRNGALVAEEVLIWRH
jgi:hypothetical protein